MSPKHQRASFTPRRRALLLATPAAAVARPSAGQPGRPAGKPLTVAQIVDTSPAQQDVSKDFLIGSRAAWQDINARGGVRGRPVTHLTVEVDGTPASPRAALGSLRDNPSCVVLSGTAGDPVAVQVIDLLRQDNLPIAHVAPWLQDSVSDVDDSTFPIFASRQEQIVHALKSLTTLGVKDVGAVFASPTEQALYGRELERVAATLNLQLKTYRGGGDLVRLGLQLTPGTPAILLFIGGTPELVQFTQGLEQQQRQRYLVALADVNLQTMVQMGGGRSIPVIATQPVPMVTASLPIVRAYRDTLGRLFDEPPATLSLAGFIAARYTSEVMAEVDVPLTRQSVLAAFRRRATLDLGGFRVSFDQRRRSGAFVTQSMLTPDGRVLG
ncbi:MULTISPECIES: ABC transporter substrate-binding protein [Ramlibacter]|uniref:ABC transporter substrate-binding protein n=1 Tax=Ramlibacter pinisoli TaxID=2682844 RepID=A0A6N8IXD1_9BURK|nr:MULTISPECIES: ABC transporter substrate-binding protein [Ramlibacter]MBA2961281.1 ABC transporter substrate-binding protein [Ramlibacter sp. CGMCC 1.13660]MVQ31225.1 ABC transporter substrate-binding protein [Ramlibacter pinisoli]